MKYLKLLSVLLTGYILVGCSMPHLYTPSPTETPAIVTSVVVLTDTPIVQKPTEAPQVETPVPTSTREPVVMVTSTPATEVWYIPQSGTPVTTINSMHADAGCSWLGVGGQVFGAKSVPITGLTVIAGGTLAGHPVGGVGITGMETYLGEGGYEITLADHPVDSAGTVWIQIVDENNQPISDKIYFNTVDDCNQNFILVNFTSTTRPVLESHQWTIYLPVLLNRTSLPVPISGLNTH